MQKKCNLNPQNLIGTAYDVVKEVADNLDTLQTIHEALVPVYQVDFGLTHGWASDGVGAGVSTGWIATGTSVTSPVINIPTSASLVWHLKADAIAIDNWLGDVVITFDDNSTTTYTGVIPLITPINTGINIDLGLLSGINKTIKRIQFILSGSESVIEFKELYVGTGFVPVSQLDSFEITIEEAKTEASNARLAVEVVDSKIDDVIEDLANLGTSVSMFEASITNDVNALKAEAYFVFDSVNETTLKFNHVKQSGQTKDNLHLGSNVQFVDSIGSAKYFWDTTLEQYVHKGVVVLPDGTVLQSSDDIIASNPIEAITAYLTRESFLVPTTSSGTNPVYAGSDTRLVLLKGNAEIGTDVLFSGGTSKNGLNLSINPVTGVFTLSGSTWSTDQEWFDITATYQGTTYTKRFTVIKQRAAGSGTNLNTITLNLYQRTARGSNPTPITNPVGYDFTSNEYIGLPTNNWTSVLPNSSLPVLWVLQKTISTSTDVVEVLPNQWAAARILSTDGVDGVDGGGSGPAGAGMYSATYSSISWLTTGTDSANERFTTLTGRSPVFGDIFSQTNATTGVMETRQWNGSSWIVVTNIINGSLIATGTLAGDAIIAGSVITSPVIRGGKLELVGVPASTHIKITSNDPFGPNSLIEWFGPKLAGVTWNTTLNAPIYTGMTKANAVSYISADGGWYTSGSILAGTLRNANQSTQLGGSTSVESGPFTSNGGSITVKVSFSASKSQSGTGACPVNSNPTAVLYLDKWNGSTWVEVSSQSATGIFNCVQEGGEYYSFWELSTSFTFTDPELAANQRQFRARVNHNVPVLPNGTQKLSLICEE